ncbi:MAG: ATP-binding cassette domain-containing protein [Oscillospiraceae bacterium]
MIEISHLTKTFQSSEQDVHALRDVSLSIDEGDIFGIIGMSGAGKSTLLRCLSMLETPTDGSIAIDGQILEQLKGKNLIETRRKMGVVFQGYNLLMQKSVADNIAFPLTLAKMPKAEIAEKVEKLLDLVSLSPKKNAYPAQLSGGQKQRVAIARALATDPEVLLCDEPTSALDSLTTKSMLSLLKQINKDLNVTIIIITHEMNVVKAICNRVAVIEDGKIAEQGNTSEVFNAPKTSITKLLLGFDEDEK